MKMRKWLTNDNHLATGFPDKSRTENVEGVLVQAMIGTESTKVLGFGPTIIFSPF